MKTKGFLIRIGLALLVAALLGAGAGLLTRESVDAAEGTYKILAWNDLGMHCYNRDFADLAVLPPYNTLWVQVIKAGDPPTLVTSGVTVEYFYEDNTYSVGKTNFWSYSQDLFGVSLPPNVGLKGKGLSGTMDFSGDHYVAEGIPVTEFSDSAPTTSQPYQLATVIVKDSVTGAELARTRVVTPVSSEMRCDKCHSDGGEGSPDNPTGKVETNILQLHDEEEGTNLMANRPVLCAKCHASNALGAPGQSGVPNLSNAMHDKHEDESPDTLDGCYNCHPGPQTKCLRDTMSQEGMTCIDCHGGMSTVKNNPDPWLNEPRCDTCHDSGQYDQNHPLYRFSTEHGGLYCEACHDSTHAVAPSREENDAIKFNILQGKNGPIDQCQVCHTITPSTGSGPHGLTSSGSLFEDVPSTYWAREFIERLYNAGITGGCSTSPLMYCPDSTVTRAQMAIFILRGIHGSTYVPPTASGTVFGDVPVGSFAADWIEQLAAEGVTAGCGGGNYCPDATITRAQMAIFLLRGEHGSVYTPPAATGTVFGDVPLGSFADAWIEQLALEGVTSGCGSGNYCPDNSVTRAEMAVFLVRAFSLP
ncbi:S-layer homology domain-containing protein [Candidatus Villigracilis affinis]|uniref:S-layer homology domain-containing protein n=1 Tax=Candidatus Villigracilis affinis TaxID=3140682 RepID=UPI001E06BF1D|nr:S-layer homology domain-containing protein [Anaerolineales bacterium]MBL0344615.1 S-layer homology domain-containing protein [Anaerolineales bacterium]